MRRVGILRRSNVTRAEIITKQLFALMLIACLSACGHSPAHQVGTELEPAASPEAAAPEQPVAGSAWAPTPERASEAPAAPTPAPGRETAPPTAAAPRPEPAPIATPQDASASQQPVDVSPWDAKDSAADQEASKLRFEYPKARFDRWRFKGRCQKKQLKEYAYHMGAESCFEQAQQLDGGVAQITARFAAQSHELSVKAEVPALAKGKVRKQLEDCVQMAVESSGNYWGSKKPPNWDAKDQKLVCTLRYRITQSYERTASPRRRQDKPRRVRDPAAYRLKTHRLTADEPCNAEAIPEAIEPQFDSIKECLSLAGNGLFGRHRATFYLNDAGGMSAHPQTGDSSPDLQGLRQEYKRRLKESHRQCAKAADKKACRKEARTRIDRWRRAEQRKRGGFIRTTADDTASHPKSKAQQVVSRCVTFMLDRAQYRKALGAGLDPRRIRRRSPRSAGRRSRTPPKTVCEVNWVFEHSRHQAP